MIREWFTYLYGSCNSQINLKETPIKELMKSGSVTSYVSSRLPVDWYFNYVLDIRYDEPEDILDETEIFELDNLQKWVVRKSLLRLRD